MPDLPALPLGAPVVGRRATRASRRPRLQGPGAIAQEARLAPRLQRLTDAFLHGRLTTPADPAALPPEQVIVLEVAGELGDFTRAVRRIPGLEFLVEEAEDRLESDATFAAVDRDGKRHNYSRQLFLVASDAVAWQQLLELWERFKRGDPFPYGLTPFRDLFARLRDVRAWDDHDRLERTGALATWREDFAGMDGQLVEFETELWLRGDHARRETAIAGLRSDLANVGGTILDQLVVEEIDYHGVLARVPRATSLTPWQTATFAGCVPTTCGSFTPSGRSQLRRPEKSRAQRTNTARLQPLRLLVSLASRSSTVCHLRGTPPWPAGSSSTTPTTGIRRSLRDSAATAQAWRR